MLSSGYLASICKDSFTNLKYSLSSCAFISNFVSAQLNSQKFYLPVNIGEMFNSNLSFSISLLHVGFKKMLVMLNGMVPETNRDDTHRLQAIL